MLMLPPSKKGAVASFYPQALSKQSVKKGSFWELWISVRRLSDGWGFLGRQQQYCTARFLKESPFPKGVCICFQNRGCPQYQKDIFWNYWSFWEALKQFCHLTRCFAGIAFIKALFLRCFILQFLALHALSSCCPHSRLWNSKRAWFLLLG